MLEQLIQTVQRMLKSETPRSVIRENADDLNGKRAVRRKKERLSEGFIASDRMITPRPCSIRDLTVLGSRVDLWEEISPSLLLTGVTLYSVADRKEVQCEVSWQRGNSLGLRFKGPFREPSRNYKKQLPQNTSNTPKAKSAT